MKFGGAICFVLSILLIGYALTMDVSVSTGYGRVNNLGLMSERQNSLIIGGFLFLASVILHVFAKDYSCTKKCPVCAEKVKIDALKCRFCGAEQTQTQYSEKIYTSDKIDEGTKTAMYYTGGIAAIIIFIVLCFV